LGGFGEDARGCGRGWRLVGGGEAAGRRLRSLWPSEQRLGLYLGFLGSLRGTGSPVALQLGDDPRTGVDRGAVRFATAPLGLPVSNGGPQWLVRIDHNLSDEHRLALRYIYDFRTTSPVAVTFPGFITDQGAQNQNLLFTDHY